jgi:hypothetical protein
VWGGLPFPANFQVKSGAALWEHPGGAQIKIT